MASDFKVLEKNEHIRLLKAMRTIKVSHGDDYETIIDWLQRLLDDQDKKNRSTEAVVLHRGQGRAKLLDSLISKLTGCDQLLAEIIKDQQS